MAADSSLGDEGSQRKAHSRSLGPQITAWVLLQGRETLGAFLLPDKDHLRSLQWHHFSSWAPTAAPWHKHLLLPFTKHLPSEPALQWEHRRSGKRLAASCLLQALEVKCAKLALQLRSNTSAYPSHVLGLPFGEQPPACGQETQTFGCTSHIHTQNSDLASGW